MDPKAVLYTAIFRLLLIVPFLCFAYSWRTARSKKPFQGMVLFAAFYLLYEMAYLLPHAVPALRFINGRWNWESKIVALFAGLAFIFAYKKISREEYGLVLKQNKGAVKDRLLWIVIACMVVGGIFFATFSPAEAFSWETVAFELTMPGIEEELIFRGILLAMLNRAFGRRHSILGAHCGWGLFIVAILFGMQHGVHVDSGFHVTLRPIALLTTGLMGFWFGWIRERTGSLLLPVNIHNLTNTINTLIVMLK